MRTLSLSARCASKTASTRRGYVTITTFATAGIVANQNPKQDNESKYPFWRHNEVQTPRMKRSSSDGDLDRLASDVVSRPAFNAGEQVLNTMVRRSRKPAASVARSLIQDQHQSRTRYSATVCAAALYVDLFTDAYVDDRRHETTEWDTPVEQRVHGEWVGIIPCGSLRSPRKEAQDLRKRR
jgi:hypothetical protein